MRNSEPGNRNRDLRQVQIGGRIWTLSTFRSTGPGEVKTPACDDRKLRLWMQPNRQALLNAERTCDTEALIGSS
jgi:hypothetical protein